MSEEERFQYLANNCVYLISTEQNGKRLSLFACDTFFLEVRYDLSGDGISDMEVVMNAGKMDDFLTEIELKDIRAFAE